MVLRTGNALQLLRRFQPEHPLCCIEKETSNQGDLMLYWMPLEAQSHRSVFVDDISPPVAVPPKIHSTPTFFLICIKSPFSFLFIAKHYYTIMVSILY